MGPTLHDVREVMAEGPSGLCRLPGYGSEGRPRWEPSRRRLLWPNGAVGLGFSAEDPDGLRGPQFGAAWADEFCAWAKPGETLDMLRLGLRTGADPRLAVTSTPRPLPALRRLLAEPGAVRTGASTRDNARNLAPGAVEGLERLYDGTRVARQELEGMVLEAQGALWRLEDIERARVGAAPERLERVVVGVDPPATAHGDACGIVAVGRAGEVAYVLEDRTAGGLSPLGWARRVGACVAAWGADLVVAEANQGGEMVRSVLETAGVGAPVRLAHARVGKRARAEPVAALYEQGRVRHVGVLGALEEELLGFGEAGPSPDRADALVWAVSELLVDGGWEGPRLTVLDWARGLSG